MKISCKILVFLILSVNIYFLNASNINDKDFEGIPDWLFQTTEENSTKEEEENGTEDNFIETTDSKEDNESRSFHDQKIEPFKSSSSCTLEKKRKNDDAFQQSNDHSLENPQFSKLDLDNNKIIKKIRTEKYYVALKEEYSDMPSQMKGFLEYLLSENLSGENLSQEKITNKATIEYYINNEVIKKTDLEGIQNLEPYKNYIHAQNQKNTIKSINCEQTTNPQIFTSVEPQLNKISTPKKDNQEAEEYATSGNDNDDDATRYISTENTDDPLAEYFKYIIYSLYTQISMLIYYETVQKEKNNVSPSKKIDN